jgi:hypothetical protein
MRLVTVVQFAWMLAMVTRKDDRHTEGRRVRVSSDGPSDALDYKPPCLSGASDTARAVSMSIRAS